jgi:hypothetical protein
MPQKVELIRKIQDQRRFLDDLLLEIAAFHEPESAAPSVMPQREPRKEAAQ